MDRRWSLCSAITGILAVASYVTLIFASVPGPLAALLAFGFSFGFALASIALHLGVMSAVAPRLGLLGAVANTVAAGLVIAMLLVQMAVKAAVPDPGPAFTAIWLGLDVAWDLFGGVGTLLIAWALWYHPRFRPILPLLGVAVALLMLVLNLATFPIPPAEAGSVDVGPLVALWYVVLSIRILVLARVGHPSPASA
ncbi:MAG TPA: hypothetical protein VFH97_09810 [Gemmatimonadales bacterium]|nr:hypothetical protein [Gemmatimonadales bacterium]